MPSQSHSISDLELAITRYCAAHAKAADTVDGVRTWWLAAPACPLADVEAALVALVARGVLAVRRLADGTAIYFCRASE